MERLPNKVLENAIRIYTATINAFENFKDDYCSSLDRATVQLLEELKEYRSLEEQGLLLKLPCKVGDTVYTACSWGIESGVVGSIEIISDRIFVNNIHGAMIGESHNIFLTKEEAEQALKRLESES